MMQSPMGVGLAAGVIVLCWSLLWLGDHPGLGISLTVLGLVGAWGGRHYWAKPVIQSVTPPSSQGITRTAIETQLQATAVKITILKDYTSDHTFEPALETLRHALNRNQLQIAIWGQAGQQLDALQNTLQARFPQLAPIPIREDLSQPPTADLILFVISGDLSKAEHQALQTLENQAQRFLLLWQHLQPQHPGAMALVEQALSVKLSSRIPPQDWIRVGIGIPGRVSLETRLEQIIATEQPDLILRAILTQAQQLDQQVINTLAAVRRQLAHPIITRYQWLGAGAAAVNPLPILDLVLTGGLLVQLTLELGKLYDRSFNLTQARPLAETLLKTLVQFGAVEITTHSLSHWLKGNSLTYLAGSCIQGASAAYLLRVAGLSLIDYWQTLPDTPPGPNATKLLRHSVQQTLTKLKDLAPLHPQALLSHFN